MPGSDDNKRLHSIGEIENWNLDRTVDPPTKVVGIMKKSGGNWSYWDGTITTTSAPLSADSSSVSAIQGDAGKLRISAIGVSVSTSPLSADSSSISAKSDDAGTMLVSAKQGDAGLLRMSAIGVSVTTSPLSADSSSISAIQEGANRLRVSAFVDSGSISAKSTDAGTHLVSAKQGDAANLRVSAIIDSGSISAKGTVSAFINQGTVSAYSPDAALFRISGIGTFTVSAHEVKQSDATSLLISAKTDSAAQFRVSSFVDSGSVSAKQSDAGNLRVSSALFPDTVGGLTVFRSLSVSASQNVKSTAAGFYGYYAWNTDTKPNYIKFYNVSGAVNLGTDTPILTKMLPASAAANIEFPHGLKGFTSGIGVAATSAVADNATSAPAASAVGINIFYN